MTSDSVKWISKVVKKVKSIYLHLHAKTNLRIDLWVLRSHTKAHKLTRSHNNKMAKVKNPIKISLRSLSHFNNSDIVFVAHSYTNFQTNSVYLCSLCCLFFIHHLPFINTNSSSTISHFALKSLKFAEERLHYAHVLVYAITKALFHFTNVNIIPFALPRSAYCCVWNSE